MRNSALEHFLRRTGPVRLRKIILTLLAMLVLIGVTVTDTTPASAHNRPSWQIGQWQKRTVYVENHASRAWPVKAAAETWDNGNRLDLRVVDRCPKNSQCIVVKSSTLAKGTAGMANITYHAGNSDIAKVQIRLNSRYAQSFSTGDRRATICHEIGHALGLAHRATKRSCLAGNINGASGGPDRADRNHLIMMYGKGH